MNDERLTMNDEWGMCGETKFWFLLDGHSDWIDLAVSRHVSPQAPGGVSDLCGKTKFGFLLDGHSVWLRR
jgi:hypothetical protein